MKEKELKRLSRAELLELLLVQTRETEHLRKKMEKMEAELSERRLKMENVGDLAQAVMAVNGVMEAAQAAAQQYLENIAQMEQETKLACEKILADARKRAEMICQRAKQSAEADETLVEEIYALLDENNE